MCRFFAVSRSGYYAYQKRRNIPDKDLPLANNIKKCQEKCHRTYGYRRVQIWLERHGIYKNPKTVLRVMQKYNLLSVVCRKKFQYCSQYLHRYPNSLNRDFTADRPNQKWVTDISYIKTGQGFVYLSIIRDLYDNSIVAYKTDKEQTIKLYWILLEKPRKKKMSLQSCSSTVSIANIYVDYACYTGYIKKLLAILFILADDISFLGGSKENADMLFSFTYHTHHIFLNNRETTDFS